VLEDGGSQVLGYLNTDSDLPGIYRSRNFLGTMLHGPVLSRNPEMLRLLLSSLASATGMALPELTDAKKADHVAGLIAEVWKLEEQLASE
jgi:CobQ-like glutamine amidotransferase family enzyme